MLAKIGFEQAEKEPSQFCLLNLLVYSRSIEILSPDEKGRPPDKRKHLAFYDVDFWPSVGIRAYLGGTAHCDMDDEGSACLEKCSMLGLSDCMTCAYCHELSGACVENCEGLSAAQCSVAAHCHRHGSECVANCNALDAVTCGTSR